MVRRAMGFTIAAALGVGLILNVSVIRGGEPAHAKALTADDVIRLWQPLLKDNTDYHQMGGSPERAPGVAAWSFRVVGPTFEELWNHYAERCGMKQRYAEQTFVITSGTGPNGSYVLSERPSADGKSGRGPAVFLLKADTYTVAVTIQPDPGGKSTSGSLTAVVP
jgi:hypothetical protein